MEGNMLPYLVIYELNGKECYHRLSSTRPAFARSATEAAFPGCVVMFIMPGAQR